MPARRPFLKRLATLTVALLAVAALCRHQGVNADVPVVHRLTAAIFPSPPDVAWAADSGSHDERRSLDAALVAPPSASRSGDEPLSPADGLLAAGLALVAVGFAARLARTWMRDHHDVHRSPAR